MISATWTEFIRLHVEPCKRMPGRMWEEYQMVEWGYGDWFDERPMIEKHNQYSYFVQIPNSGRHDPIHGRLYDAYQIIIHVDRPQIPADLLYLYRNGMLDLTEVFNNQFMQTLQSHEVVSNSPFDVMTTWKMTAERGHIEEVDFICMEAI